MKDLNQCRIEIDEIDEQIMALFEKRMNVSQNVIEYKLQENLPVFQPERERIVIEKNALRIKNKALIPYSTLFIQDLMNVSKAYQTSFMPPHFGDITLKEPKKDAVVGFQGVPGSFSEQALNTYFSSHTKRKNYKQFKDVFEALKNDEIDYGIVPLENSSTGAICDNYDYIREYGFSIVDEQSLAISQHLMALKGATIDTIKEVYSHPQGLLQSSDFLDQHPSIEQKEYPNTAMAAKFVAQSQDLTLGAIASRYASELYDLEILQDSIQNASNNETRFIVFAKELEKNDHANCVSVVFTLNHIPGALYQVMKVINDHHVNMRRIESRPLIHSPWEYYFYVDFDGNLCDQNILMMIEDVKAYTNTLRILGHYEKS